MSTVRRRAVNGKKLTLGLVAAGLLAVLVVESIAGGVPMTGVGHSGASSSTASSEPSVPAFPPQQGCNYTVSLYGSTPVAVKSSGGESVDSAGTDVSAFINSFLASHETVCVSAGDYTVESEIQVNHMRAVTLQLDPGAVMNASLGSRLLLQQYVRGSLILINGSLGTVVDGGEWIGPGRGRAAGIRVQDGSNGTVIEGANISGAGWDGIIVYDTYGPSYNVSVLDNVLHNNGRYGFQEYTNGSTRYMGTTVSGNNVVDNQVGGIYTNGVGGVTISDNVVENTHGDTPGMIGIGVTNGGNDTVSSNRVQHMEWFGIQAFYNNHTVIANNTSLFNAGGEDQSGITNDHSSFDTITGNVVEFNGGYGIYVERSWNLTISGNTADENFEYGIELNHGTIPDMGLSTISDNTCSFNSLGGIILNSAVDNTISMNTCDDNPSGGILLYNDLGQVGSTGNIVAKNWVCNVGNLEPTQTFGIKEFNQSGDNLIVSNVSLNDTLGPVSLVGTNNTYTP